MNTTLGRAIILSGTDDLLTPRRLGAETFRDAIGDDVVEIIDVEGAGHPGYDKNMHDALVRTINKIVDEVIENRTRRLGR